MRSILKRLSRRHTTAVAYLALFAALGGSVYAAATITGKNIKDGTVLPEREPVDGARSTSRRLVLVQSGSCSPSELVRRGRSGRATQRYAAMATLPLAWCPSMWATASAVWLSG